MEYLEKNKLITSIQCGFRKSRSTIDHLCRLDTYIRKSFSLNKVTVGVFFDLEKAYDTTWKYGILRDLYQMGFRGRLPIYIEHFLEDRKFQVICNNTLSDEYKQQAGVPQGSILSVTLFSIKINSLSQIIPNHIHASLFVDDLQISYSDYIMNSVVQEMQPAINSITDWADKNGFRFSTTKTFTMVFHMKPSYLVLPSLKLQNFLIPVKSNVKFLGLFWDSQLNWQYHITQLKASCNKSMNLLRTMSSYSMGADQHVLLHAYRLIIRPKLDYGSTIYGAASEAALRSLDAIHNEALRISCGAFKSSPLESLYILCNEPSLCDRRKDLLCRYYCKMKSNITNVARPSIVNYELTQFYSSHHYLAQPIIMRIKTTLEHLNLQISPVLPTRTSTIFSWEMQRPTIDVDLAMLNVKLIYDFSPFFNEHIDSRYLGFKLLFTDGSLNNKGVGAAVVFGDLCRTATLPKCASIFTTEIHAIKMACHLIRDDTKNENRRYIICTDSLGVVQSIPNLKPKNEAISRLQTQLHEIIITGKQIVVLWIPGHANIQGNCKADELARHATSGMETLIPIPYTDFFPHVKEALLNSWTHRWRNTNLHLVHIHPYPKKWKKESLTRRQEVIINRLRLGHTRLTHGYLMETVQIRPSCLWCNDAALSIEHIFLHCKGIEQQRTYSFSPHTNRMPNLTLQLLLKSGCNVGNLFDFLETLGIFMDI